MSWEREEEEIKSYTSKKTPNNVFGMCRALAQDASTSRLVASNSSCSSPSGSTDAPVQPLITTVNARMEQEHKIAQLQRFTCSCFCLGLNPILMLLPANVYN
jgi:hypothetical protein